MIMSFEGYQEALESQKEKEDKLTSMEKQFNNMQSQMQTLISALASIKDQNQINQTAQMLYKSGILNNDK
jgi:ABC-type Fe3+-citrate transport system substrate-binding protein